MGSQVHALAERHGGATYVCAVNMFRKPENAAIAVKGGAFTDSLPPHAVHRWRYRGRVA